MLANPWDRLPNYWTQLVEAVAVINADYNDDGIVNAADYVVWRKTDGTQAGFNNWRANFGKTVAGGGAGAGGSVSAVPEPATQRDGGPRDKCPTACGDRA